MQKTLKVTLLVVPVVALVSLLRAEAFAASIHGVKPKNADQPSNQAVTQTTIKQTKQTPIQSSTHASKQTTPSLSKTTSASTGKSVVAPSNKTALTSTQKFPITTLQQAQMAQSQKVVMKADQLEKQEKSDGEPQVGIALQISRGTSLYDHQDGSRSDSMDYLAMPHMKLGFGTVKAKIVYSQNLREDGNTYDGTTAASDWGDVSVTVAKNPYKWMWSYPYMITLTPFVSGVIPASQNSLKRDELKTAVSAGVSFGVIPDGIAPESDGFWSFAIGVTAGRNIHAYDTDINGKVLNRYSSNQTLNFSYNYKAFSFGIEFINKSRWTYQGNVKNAFEHSQEVGYNFTENVSLAIGHTNGGNALKANGIDSNLELVNENDSSVYATLGLSF